MLEFYAAYMDYIELMKFTEKLFDRILKDVFKTNIIKIGENELTLKVHGKNRIFALLENIQVLNMKKLTKKDYLKSYRIRC